MEWLIKIVSTKRLKKSKEMPGCDGRKPLGSVFPARSVSSILSYRSRVLRVRINAIKSAGMVLVRMVFTGEDGKISSSRSKVSM
jgi:hypothetical protein